MRIIGAIALVLSVAVLLFAAAQQTPKPEIPVLPTERDQFGGRPGTFHFVTNEQTMADAAELQKAVAALELLDKKLAGADRSTQERLSPELQTLKAFVVGVQSKQSRSAGDTAKQIEDRLTAAKGKFMCGACHGHGMGMMHGRGMRMMGGKAN